MSGFIREDDITFTLAWPLKHMEPHGMLPMTREAACLWSILIGLTQALDKIPKQATLEGNDDLSADLMQIVRSNQKIYGVIDLNQVFNKELVFKAEREAARCNLPWNPQINAFIDSGGRSYRFVERDPNKVAQ